MVVKQHASSSEKISEDRRVQINSQYWDTESQEQKAFVLGCADKLNKKSHTVLVDSRRSCTN